MKKTRLYAELSYLERLKENMKDTIWFKIWNKLFKKEEKEDPKIQRIYFPDEIENERRFNQ